MRNRLDLDFSLKTAEERGNFVRQYLDPNAVNPHYKNFPFKHTPTAAELEKIADYILYGKTQKTNAFNSVKSGKSLVDSGYVYFPEKKTQAREPLSLDSLMTDAHENGTPLESQDSLLSNITGDQVAARSIKIPKAYFDREKCREALYLRGDHALLAQFEALWKEIDKIDYKVGWYDLQKGTRTKPIRKELVDRLTPEETLQYRLAALDMTIYDRVRQARLLIELRTEQYSLRDGYSVSTKPVRTARYSHPSAEPSFQILPFGLYGEPLFFEAITPQTFEPEALSKIAHALSEVPAHGVNLEDETIFANLINAMPALLQREYRNIEAREEVESLLKTIYFFVRKAELNEVERRILQLKIDGRLNATIAAALNKEFGTSYSQNYISTIFRNRCIKKITAAIGTHRFIINQILNGGADVFKTCSTCGTIKPKNASFFVRKTRSKDGLSARCKKCDKEKRTGGK